MKSDDVKNIIADISDIFAIIRKNYKPFCDFREDIKYGEFEQALDIIAEKLSKFRDANYSTLMGIMYLATSGDSELELSKNYANQLTLFLNKRERNRLNLSRELQSFGASLQEFRDFLGGFSTQFIRYAPDLYERIDESLLNRIRVIEFLANADERELTKVRIAELAEFYHSLIAELDGLKRELYILRNRS